MTDPLYAAKQELADSLDTFLDAYKKKGLTPSLKKRGKVLTETLGLMSNAYGKLARQVLPW